MKIKLTVLALALTLGLTLTGSGPAAAQDPEPYSLSVSATYAGRYVWRGLVLNPDSALQPGLELSRGGFTLGSWASIDLTDSGERAGYGDERGNATEVDFYANVAIPLGDQAELSAGFLNYTFPHTGYEDTTELFAELALEAPLAPTLSAYVDEGAGEGAGYFSLGLSHSFELGGDDDWGLALDLAGQVGYANGKYFELYLGRDTPPEWSDWSTSVALPVSIPGGLTLTPTGVYSAMIGEDNRRAVESANLDPDNWVFLATLSWETEF